MIERLGRYRDNQTEFIDGAIIQREPKVEQARLYTSKGNILQPVDVDGNPTGNPVIVFSSYVSDQEVISITTAELVVSAGSISFDETQRKYLSPTDMVKCIGKIDDLAPGLRAFLSRSRD